MAFLLLGSARCIDSFVLADPCRTDNGGCPEAERCTAAVDGAVTCGCPAGLTRCGAVCTDVQADTNHCGACGRRCAEVSGRVVGCAQKACTLSCLPGFTRIADECRRPPRLIAPLSLGDVTQRRPTLRWVLSPGHDGAVVELCRDRPCSQVIETLTVRGDRARPEHDLPARSVVFWRIRERAGDRTDTLFSPTWLFHVPGRGASEGVDSSSNPHCDVNGDGYDDVVVGALHASPGGRVRAGRASVYHGSPSGVGTVPAAVLEGVGAGDRFGVSVAGAGDVNGDGYGDLVVGANLASPDGDVRTGAASVFLGGPSGVATAPSRVLGGDLAADLFGDHVATAGDVNGDGYADLVVGAHRANVAGRPGVGTASVYHGGPSGVGPTPARVLQGVDEDEQFGWRVATAGDLNGDTYSDLVVGAVFASPGGRHRAGTVLVYPGGPGGVPAAPSHILAGVGAVDLFGVAVESAGDINGDGYDDLIVGASGVEAPPRNDVGAVSVFYGGPAGVSTRPAIVLEGVGQTDNLGTSVTGTGDVDGDGVDDIAAGAVFASPGGRLRAGAVRVFSGGRSGVSAQPLRVLEGRAAGDALGVAVAGGDVNGDGYGDLIVGAHQSSPGLRSHAGVVYLHHGGPGGLRPTPDQVLEGEEPDGQAGISVAQRRRGVPPRSRAVPGLPSPRVAGTLRPS